MNPQHLTEHLSTPFVDDYDVVVAGGGASGLIAAVSASRTGARTLLLERANCMGGTGTTSMVAQWIGFFNRDRQVVGGIANELAQRVVKLGGSEGFKRYLMAEASAHPIPLVHFAFNPETVKIACDQLALAAGVSVRLHSRVVAPILEKGRVTGVVVEDAAGRSAIRARRVVDATGDASVAQAAGVELAHPEVQSKRDAQPCTLMFRLSNVDVAAFRAIPREHKRALALKGIAEKKIYCESLSFCSTPGNTDAICLMSRVSGFDTTDPQDLTNAEMEGRRQIGTIVEFLKANVAGFDQAILAGIAAHIGVRETRRIVGRYTLTEDDILGDTRFPDSIALGAGPLDIHETGGTGIRLHVPDQPFEIPMRCLVPARVQGLLVTGRAISATRSANGGARHMATAMALGEAAGVLAALSVASDQDVPADEVRALLRERGAYVSLEDAEQMFEPA
ncbi:FAD-dependent oxidoreductase [Hydrogenophaga sp.]|uniref:FAD-dependent oxidoreductase n=1 Tax=Hydrogenophaga sp. TaxID=1904254 RepID=UPI003F6FCD7C